MRRQPPSGQPAYHIFNLGFSAWGRKLSATACTHKATKTALSVLTEALGDDLKAAGKAREAGTASEVCRCCVSAASTRSRGSCQQPLPSVIPGRCFVQVSLPSESTTCRQAWYSLTCC
jgi:hypothetical protein